MARQAAYRWKWQGRQSPSLPTARWVNADKHGSALRAKYACRCWGCDEPITVGSKLLWNPDTNRRIHAGCKDLALEKIARGQAKRARLEQGSAVEKEGSGTSRG